MGCTTGGALGSAAAYCVEELVEERREKERRPVRCLAVGALGSGPAMRGACLAHGACEQPEASSWPAGMRICWQPGAVA